MKNDKLDIFEKNADFFESFSNSLEDTAKDRFGRVRFTITGIDNKIEFAVNNAQGRIQKAENDAVNRLNNINGITNDELISKSTGAGKWLREGAYGVGSYFLGVNDTLLAGSFGGFGNYSILRSFRTSGVGFELRNFYSQDRFELRRFYNSSWQPSVEIKHSKNTTQDINGVLHNGTITPINTLNTSDMSDTVVNRDDLTVTSGAVYRAIKELREIIDNIK